MRPVTPLTSWAKTPQDSSLEVSWYCLGTSESIIGFYLLQAPIEGPRDAREENYSFVLEHSEGTQLDFLSAADRPAIRGTGYPVPKKFLFRADIFVLFQKHNNSDKQ